MGYKNNVFCGCYEGMRDEERTEGEKRRKKKEIGSFIFTNSTYNSCIMTIKASRVVYSMSTSSSSVAKSPKCTLYIIAGLLQTSKSDRL